MTESREQKAERICDQISNGNLDNAIDILMDDGDVRVENVMLALEVQSRLTMRRMMSVERVTEYLIRLIETWETQL